VHPSPSGRGGSEDPKAARDDGEREHVLAYGGRHDEVAEGGAVIDGACAVSPTTDLRRHAQLLHRAHDAALTGGAPPVPVRRLVTRSWERMRTLGLDPDQRSGTDPAGPDVVERRRAGSPLATVLPELRRSLTAVAESADHIMVVTAADGFVLWREGSQRVGRLADNLGFSPGATWTEDAVGTNAIGTALAEHSSVQLFSAEHFARSQHPWTCTACPVHDPRTGELLGVVDLSGPARTVHPTTVALVDTAVRLAERVLWTGHEARLDALRAVAAPLMARLGGPALVVDDHGWVVAVQGAAVGERVGAPVAGEPVAVTGLGPCLPEPVPGGWLLRPAPSRPGRMRLWLDLDEAAPAAVVEGSETWRYPLVRRHAQILALLMAAGPDGLTAATLSTRLHGDRDHQVAVRAEVSRLRRVVGGLLQARPYRFVPGVEVVAPDPATLAALLR